MVSAISFAEQVVSNLSRMRSAKTLLSLVSFLTLGAINLQAQNTLIPVVTIHASDQYASWAGDTGTFTFFRDGPTNQELHVYYLIRGSASNGVDYATIGNWVTIPPAVRTNSVTISPIDLGQTNVGTVTLELSPSPLAIPQNYEIGYPAAATVYILPANLTNIPPNVKIFQPTNGSEFTAPVDIPLAAFADDPDGSVTSVEFFAGDHSLGIADAGAVLDPPFPDGTGPGTRAFFLLWTNPAPGSYTLTAKATDNDGASAVSAPIKVTVLPGPPPTNHPPLVKISTPGSGTVFLAPADIPICASASDSDGYVATVEFFAGDHSLGIRTNNPANAGPMNPFCLIWSNVPPGSYTLTAVATDNDGAATKSEPVKIAVAEIPTNRPPVVKISTPSSGTVFLAPADIPICASASDSDGYVATVEFFSGDHSLGIKTNNPVSTGSANPFCLIWSNVPSGSYTLTAVATDNDGAATTSEPVKVLVVGVVPPPTNHPPMVRLTSPPNGSIFSAPINLPIYAYAADRDGFVASVEFFAGTNDLGAGQGLCLEASPGSPLPLPVPVCPTNIFLLVWSNAPVGAYSLTAIATDNAGLSATSEPVKVTIMTPPPPPTNRPTIVDIIASDPIAIEGTNCWPWLGLAESTPSWNHWTAANSLWRFFTNCGPKNAAFTVHRFGATNDDLTVTYEVGGSATSGVDYVPLSGEVVIPAGQRHSEITVIPLDDGPPDMNSTVVVGLTRSTNYVLGFPRKAAVLILDRVGPRAVSGLLSDHSFHFEAPGPDGAWFHLEYSTDLLNWTPICTNQVVNGSIDFIDPDSSSDQSRFYRTVPESAAPLY
jgi:hypothetical protein